MPAFFNLPRHNSTLRPGGKPQRENIETSVAGVADERKWKERKEVTNTKIVT